MYDWLERRKLLWMKVAFSIVASIPLIVMLYFIWVLLIYFIFREPFWVLLIFSFIWFYLFVVEGLLCLYGLLRFDFASRLKRNCKDCLNDLKEILDKIGLNYEVRRLIKGYMIKTKFGNILLVSLSYPAGPYILLESTAIFCTSNLLSNYDDLAEYIIIYYY